jgi:hypothetical protein
VTYRVPGGVPALVAINHLPSADVIRVGAGLLVPANPPYTDELEAWRPTPRFEGELRACRSARWPAPAGVEEAGCGKAACSERAGDRLCVCVGPDEGHDRFTLTRADGATVRWPASTFMGETVLWEARDADLDGDGEAELVVAWLVAVGNGLGISHWRLAILGPDAFHPTLAGVQDYGVGTLLDAERGCHVLATSWEWLDDPLRGEGTYLVGRPWRWSEGALVPSGEPLLARRLLQSFRRLEAAPPEPEHLSDLAGMLGDARTEAYAKEPVRDGVRLAGARAGRVVDVTLEAPDGDEGEPRLALTVDWDDGGHDVLRRGPAWEGGYERLAEGPLVLPDDYVPAQPTKVFSGRRVRLVTTKDAWDNPSTVLRLL